MSNNKNIFYRKEHGAAMMITIVIILGIVLLIAVAVSLTTLLEQKMAINYLKSSQSFYAADSGTEDGLYRIIRGKKYQAVTSFDVGSSTVAVNISGTNNEKEILANGSRDNRLRNIKVKLGVSTAAVSFYYGVQVGEGGLVMGNNSFVDGSVYSNGPIQGGAGATIIGDAFVASDAGNINQQSIMYDSDFVFGRQGDQIDAAQSFVPTINGKLTKIALYIKKVGLPGDKTVRILTDDGNQPSKNLVGAGSLGTLRSSALSQTNYGWIEVGMDTPTNLIAGVKYWIMVDSSSDSNNYFVWGKDSSDSYLNGTGKYSPNWNVGSPDWYNVGGDLNFKAWLGTAVNGMADIDVGANAHANTIEDCVIGGDAYYQTIISSTVSGTEFPGSEDPGQEPLPISEANIFEWKDGATSGGTFSGDYILNNFAVGSLGPIKIDGNLIVDNGAELTVLGTIYVTGNITISNNAVLILGNNYGENSGVVLGDGFISITNNAIFNTPVAGSYLMLLSTKSGDAIDVNNNSNTVIFYASAGNITVANNAQLKEVTGYKITLANNSRVNYELGLASAKFSTGAGAGWVVESWQEVP